MAKVEIRSAQDKAYFDYINEHIKNVQMTFEKLGEVLYNVFDFSYEQVAERVKVHDESKYSDIEFNGYRQYYNPKPACRPRQDLLDRAWEHHYQNNDHHPEYWMIQNNLTTHIRPMSADAIAEMFFDWAAMGVKFKSRPDIWYKNTGYKELPLNEVTRQTIERILEEFDWSKWEWPVKEEKK